MREIAFIEKTLTESSQLLMARYDDKGDLVVSRKSLDGEMVTKTDVEIQDLIAERLMGEFPGDFLVAEELAESQFPSSGDSRSWILDPIDGTHNFIRGLFPVFGISLAFAVGGVPTAAGIALPGLNSLFLAEKGSGAFRNGRRIHVSDVSAVREAKVEVEFPRLSTRLSALSTTQRLMEQVGQIRASGCAVASLCSVATGDSDAFIHPTLELWDYAAGMLIVTEAGGMTSRLNGTNIDFLDGERNILETNGHLHNDLLSLVISAREGTR